MEGKIQVCGYPCARRALNRKVYGDQCALTVSSLPDLPVILQSLLDELCDFRYFHPGDFTAPQHLFPKTNCYLKTTNQIVFSNNLE